MTMSRLTPAALLLLVSALLLGVTGELYAGGQQEDPVEEARRLVAEGRLNEAILVLQEAVRENPERIQEAAEILEQIHRIRGDYNQLFANLIDNLINNPDDIETTLQIIDQMEGMDEFPNERVQEQITDARVIAQLAFDRDVAANIMSDAAALLEERRYGAAIERYLTGFDLQRQRFTERDYPQAVVDSADQAITQIRELAARFTENQDAFSNQEESFVSAVRAEDVETANLQLPPYAQRVEEFVEVETGLEQAVGLLRELRSRIAELNPEDPVDWHLRLISEFTYGPDEAGTEGIFAAVDRFLRDSRTRVAESFAETHEAMWQAAETALAEDAFETAQNEYRRLGGMAATAQEALTLATDVEAAPEEPLPEVIAAISSDFRTDLASARVTATAAEVQASHAGFALRNAGIPEAVPQDLEVLAERRATQASLVQDVRSLRDRWRRFLRDQVDVVAVELPERVAERRNETTRRVEAQTGRSVAREIETVDRIGGTRLSALENRYEETEALRRGGVRLLEGVPQANQEDAVAFVTAASTSASEGAGVPDGADAAPGEAEEESESQEGETENQEDVQVRYRFPDAGLNLFQEAAQLAGVLEADIESFIADFENEPDYVRESEPVQQHLSEARTLLNSIRSTDQQLAELVVEAENQIARSRNFRDEANDLVAEARTAIRQERIEEARRIVEQAQDRFFEAWDLQQDVAARRDSDELIQQLGDEILEAENRIVVRRTRQLVQQAEELYDNERYREAFDILVRAEETWARTHANDPNPEVQSLLRYVNAALSLAGSRELTETEPLYPVLSNYLFVAREDFAEAQELIDEGQSQAADQRLVRADENLTNVTAVRPLNWEARVLKLRILQLQNAENFDEIFERRYQDALDQRDENPQEALTALETLAALNPNYPGLQDAIVNLEIELGIRPDPVTQAQIARSNELYQEAQALVDEGGQAQTQAAISLLEEAVSLNPENDPAKLLLDELRIGLGGRATIALSSEDEQLFRRAEQLFVQNQVAQAYAIVQRLLQDENNQLYAPLLDLERRITARLGI